MILQRGKKYLQIALNSSLSEAHKIIKCLPVSDRILIEAGTPLIKQYGIEALSRLKSYYRQFPSPYLAADLKTADLALREVEMAAHCGASAVVCLGNAPVQTIDIFIAQCKKEKIDSMVDMLNVEDPLMVLRQISVPPDIVILHRGVDEENFNKEKDLPFYDIGRIKNQYDVLIAMAGGDDFNEIQRAVLNDVDIVVVWKAFYKSTDETTALAKEFLQEMR